MSSKKRSYQEQHEQEDEGKIVDEEDEDETNIHPPFNREVMSLAEDRLISPGSIEILIKALRHCLYRNGLILFMDDEPGRFRKRESHFYLLAKDQLFNQLFHEDDRPHINYVYGNLDYFEDNDEIDRLTQNIKNTLQEPITLPSKELLLVKLGWVNSNPNGVFKGTGAILLLLMLCRSITAFTRRGGILLELENDSDYRDFYQKTLGTYRVLSDDGTLGDGEEIRLFFTFDDFENIIGNLMSIIYEKKPEIINCLIQWFNTNRSHSKAANPVRALLELIKVKRYEQPTPKQPTLKKQKGGLSKKKRKTKRRKTKTKRRKPKTKRN